MEVLAYIEKLNAIDPTNSLSIIGSAYSKGLNRSWTDTVADLKRVEGVSCYILLYLYVYSAYLSHMFAFTYS